MLESGELINCSADGIIKVWDLNKEGCCIKTLFVHADYINSTRKIRHKTALVSCLRSGIIQIWDLNKLNCVETIATNSSVNDLIYI